MSKTKQKLVIIDGHALIHRSWHALPPTLRSKDGQLTNAVYGFTSFLLKALADLKPHLAIVAFDRAEPTFRHQVYKDYKATRVKAPDELYQQIPLVKQVAKTLGLLILEQAGYEADDLIGTVCAKTKSEKNLETIIITGDLDTLQLVDAKTKVYTMSRGLADSIIYDEDKIEERYGLKPSQLIDFKALRGDPSDNIPGVSGIGEKGAANLLKKYNNLDRVIAAAKKNDQTMPVRLAKLINQHRQAALLSRQLVTINQAVDFDLNWSEAKFPQFKLDQIFKLFSQLGFKSLLEKAKKLKEKSKTEEKEGKKDYLLINNQQKFNKFFKQVLTQKTLALSGHFNEQEKLLGLAFSWQKNQAYYLPFKKINGQDSLFAEQNNLIDKEKREKIFSLLENEKIKKIGHNLKNISKALLFMDCLAQGWEIDLMIAAHILEPDKRRNNFGSLAFTELGINFKEIEVNDDNNLIIKNICLMADLSYQLAPLLKNQLKKRNLWSLFKDLEMPLLQVLAKMEFWGISLDTAKLTEIAEKNAKTLNKLSEKIQSLAGKKFNPNSTKQLKEILYLDLDIPTEGIKKTKTGFSTAEEELNKLYNLHPIVPLLLEYRELFKLQTTYLEALPKIINKKTKKVHTHWQQSVTATGRLSSTEPNLQNIPVKTQRGRQVRSAFITKPGWRLIGFDYSQIELRLAAHLSQDKQMIKAFKEKADIHLNTAAAINKLKKEEVSPEKRQEAKAINFGIIYGQGPHGLSQAANISYYQAKQFIDRYFEIYPQIKKMMAKSIKEAKKLGYSYTLFGRQRPLPDLNSNLTNLRKAAERMAINTPIQGSAADIIKMAMIKIDELIKDKDQEIRLLLQIHDELIFEVKQAKLDYYQIKIQKIMAEITKLTVPILVEGKIGDNWEELK